jgi:glycosyltransferase involved in cell wall biosynthesis
MAKVAIITRTKDRTIMLKRAALSVGAQTYRDYVWIIVNDGGEAAPVEMIVEAAGIPESAVIHHPVNKGMEAASNAGLNHSLVAQCEYAVIHDDDDTWEPEFLEKTLAFLDSDAGSRFGGVICGTVHVDEIIHDSDIKIVSTRPWQTATGHYPEGAVQIADMAVSNQFAPIAFVYRKGILDEIGFYDEDLPVLGDWDFNLRFMMKADIAVIPERLANYHHRVSTTTSSQHYGNSVSAGYVRHYQREAMIRNEIIRKSALGGDMTMAVLMISGRHHQTTRVYMHNARRIGDLIATACRPWAGMVKRIVKTVRR